MNKSPSSPPHLHRPSLLTQSKILLAAGWGAFLLYAFLFPVFSRQEWWIELCALLAGPVIMAFGISARIRVEVQNRRTNLHRAAR